MTATGIFTPQPSNAGLSTAYYGACCRRHRAYFAACPCKGLQFSELLNAASTKPPLQFYMYSQHGQMVLVHAATDLLGIRHPFLHTFLVPVCARPCQSRQREEIANCRDMASDVGMLSQAAKIQTPWRRLTCNLMACAESADATCGCSPGTGPSLSSSTGVRMDPQGLLAPQTKFSRETQWCLVVPASRSRRPPE